MISVKAHYNQGRIVFLDPIKADIVTAELNIVITPSEKIQRRYFLKRMIVSVKDRAKKSLYNLTLPLFPIRMMLLISGI
jgi:hypothetical protein